MFRTAARWYAPWVIGVVPSGGLEDGTLGLMDVKHFGGITIVQNPNDAMFPGMPTSAIENVVVDAALPVDEIGMRLTPHARPQVRDDATDAGFDAHVPKRVSPMHLVKTIADVRCKVPSQSV